MNPDIHARQRLSILLAFSLMLVAAAMPALAAEAGGAAGMGGSGEGIFVAEIVLLLVVGRGLGELLERVGQPAVMGQLIGGILLAIAGTLPVSPYITTISFLIYLVCRLIGAYRDRTARDA